MSAVRMLIESFNWKSVNVITSNDMYGLEFLSLLYQNLRAINACISTEKLLDDSNLHKQIPEVIASIRSKPQVSVTVLLARPDMVAKVLGEARRQNLTGHVWLGSERWTGDKVIAGKYSDVLEGALGIADIEHEHEHDNFHTYLRGILKGQTYGDWMTSLLGRNVTSGLNNQVIQLSALQFGKSELIASAVQVVGSALENVLKNMIHGKSMNASSVKSNKVRKEMIGHIKKYVRNKHQKLIIVNYKKTKFETVGSWTNDNSRKDKINIDRRKIRWPGANPLLVPFSGPLKPCKPGTYVKTELNGCGWECIECPVGTHSENYTSPVCNPCPKDQIPDKLQTRCLVAEKEFVRLHDVYGICILSASALGFFITVIVLGIFLKYQNTPVVKASNIGFCLFTLVLLLVWFLSSILFLGEPKSWSCKLRTVGVPLVYTSVSALLLTKTKRLIRIFSALKQNRFLSNYWYSFVACSIVLVQVIFSAVYLVFFPPEPTDIHHNDFIVSIHCSRNLGLEIGSFSYNCLLAFLCASFAVKSRNLPETYTEAKHICLTMLTYMISWMIYFFGYYGIQHGKLKAAVPSFGVIVGAYAVLFFIFVPKMRVVLFLPEKNTKKAALAATRKYSVDVACGIQLSISRSSRACERRHTLATLPAYHESGLSTSVQSLDRNGNAVGARFSPDSLGETINEVDDIAEEDSVNVDVRSSFSIPLDNGITIKNIAYLQPNGIV